MSVDESIVGFPLSRESGCLKFPPLAVRLVETRLKLKNFIYLMPKVLNDVKLLMTKTQHTPKPERVELLYLLKQRKEKI